MNESPGSIRPRRRFRPRPWSVLLTVAGCAAFVALGIWQIRRGEQRAALDAQLVAARSAVPVDLLAHPQPPPPFGGRAATATGHYVDAQQLLLDGQSNGDDVGFDVLTPMQLADGSVLMVDRGWVASSPTRTIHTDIDVGDGTRTVHGLWRDLPSPGLRLAAHNCKAAPWPRVVSYPTPADLRCLYGARVRAGLLLLNAGEPDGFVRHWQFGDPFPPARHYAYAVQWFAFGLVALFLFIRLNRKPVP